MRCGSCGFDQLRSSAKFCGECGAPVVALDTLPAPSRSRAPAGPSSSTTIRSTSSAVAGGRTVPPPAPGSSLALLEPEPARGWYSGPVTPAGVVLDVADRPVLCLSVSGNEGVVGVSNHSLYTFNIANGRKERELYTKKYGHTEWVTCVTHLADGRILSGGMDSKLCLWNQGGVACHDLTGHTSSVSVALSNSAHPGLAVSAGYDKNVIVWHLTRRQPLSTMAGHQAAVMHGVWLGSLCGTGDRNGAVRVWDVTRGVELASLSGHKGQISAMAAVPGEDPLLLTGAQDGTVRVWDMRARTCAHRVEAHPGGAVTEIKVSAGLVVTAGADKRLGVLDPRNGFQPARYMTSHRDFIYCMDTLGDLCASGAATGEVLVHNITTGDCLYGLGVSSAGAVRCVRALPNALVAAGDDGKVSIHTYH
jgi:WD40 repeat protein